MFEFIGSVIVIYFIFKLLDWILFSRYNKKTPLVKRHVIQDGDGVYWVVEETEPVEPGIAEEVEALEKDVDNFTRRLELKRKGRPNLKVVK